MLAVLEEGVYCERSPLFQLRGQIWEEVVQPRILEELDKYWRQLAKKGRTLEEAARYYLKEKKRPSTEPNPTLTTANDIVTGLWVTLSWQTWWRRRGREGR